jgi:hypothetical protein|tara:strand:- start:31 stop:480 length:450 start_codon:yes stop_codon:yes gene_type:complete
MKLYNHRRNILSEKAAPKTKVQSGSIVRFSYTGKNVHDNQPLALVLHPRWQGKMHALNLNYIPETVLKSLWKTVQITVQGRLQRLLKLRLPLLKADIGNPKAFYYSRLKGFLKGKLGSTNIAYRTYNLGGIGGLRVVDYRFEGSGWKDK